ncbi:helix-turn-helix domain-containing protein [Myroides pelagicus]|uniref:XRE family transcriptional regulator n=1 Tax=Myroides pelagicus TaxID=270914 RepID=A0A7K1GRE2_9FLAO|nr:helix-turn-helix transcriptional regulator [Myroides pelagicus]MTH30614.1 XRE family transcriptional regulator [Myroides pelagicus]
MEIRILKYETTQFDYDFINHVRRIRKSKKISQKELSRLMGLADSFVGNVESLTQVHKYSTRHIPLLTKAFKFNNIAELFDFDIPTHDLIQVIVEQKVNIGGDKERVVSSKVVKIEVCSE